MTTLSRVACRWWTIWPHAQIDPRGGRPAVGPDSRTHAAELDIDRHHVELAGWRSQEQLLALYHRAHVFLHPSELTATNDQEGIPNSLLEAMATGLPVVAALHGGIPEAVVHGEDGLLVPERSPKLLAAALLSLTRDAALLERFSIRAAANVEKKFGAARQLQILEGYYAEAISGL